MSRLTIKNPNGKKQILNNGTIINHFSDLTDSWMICDKLGLIEDLMEKYNINDLVELEIALDYYEHRYDNVQTRRIDNNE